MDETGLFFSSHPVQVTTWLSIVVGYFKFCPDKEKFYQPKFCRNVRQSRNGFFKPTILPKNKLNNSIIARQKRLGFHPNTQSSHILINLWNYRGYDKPNGVTLYVSDIVSNTEEFSELCQFWQQGSASLSKFEHIWASLIKFEQVWARLSTFEHV